MKSSHLTSNPALLPTFPPLTQLTEFPPEGLSPLSLSRIGRQKRIRSLLLTVVLWTRKVFRRAVGVSEEKKGDTKGMRGHRQW